MPEHYVLDVFRVSGGQMHTYCFHGCTDDEFKVNVGELQTPTGEYRKYLADYYYDKKYYSQIQHGRASAAGG